MLDIRVLCFDTDSVIFVSRPGDVELEIGPYLGELTNELASPDDYIIEFVSGGPKNNAFRTIQGEQICRIRGFSLNYQNAQLLNFLSMLDIVTDQSKTLTVTNSSNITRSKFPIKIYNSVENKQYQLVYSKRAIQLNSYDTLPYGY